VKVTNGFSWLTYLS